MALVVPSYYPEVFGGAERQAKILSQALGRLGMDVTLIAPALQASTALCEPAEFGRVVRLRVRSLPANGGRNLLSTLSWVRQAKALARSIPPFDFVYIFHARLHALAGLEIARIHQAPAYVKLGGQGGTSDFAALRAKRFGYGVWTLQQVLRRTAVFVANSSEIEQDLLAEGVEPERILALPNGAELPPLYRLQERRHEEGVARLLFAGRLSAGKRVDLLLHALAQARARGAAATLTFLGDGPERGPLQRLTHELRLKDAVRFEGFTPDTLPAFLDHEFFVSASQNEGQSNALLEALASGCIPIVAPASGARALVQSGRTGILCERGDAADFADAFVQAAALPLTERRRWSEAGRRLAEETLSIEYVAREILSAFAPKALCAGDKP